MNFVYLWRWCMWLRLWLGQFVLYSNASGCKRFLCGAALCEFGRLERGCKWFSSSTSLTRKACDQFGSSVVSPILWLSKIKRVDQVGNWSQSVEPGVKSKVSSEINWIRVWNKVVNREQKTKLKSQKWRRPMWGANVRLPWMPIKLLPVELFN